MCNTLYGNLVLTPWHFWFIHRTVPPHNINDYITWKKKSPDRWKSFQDPCQNKLKDTENKATDTRKTVVFVSNEQNVTV